MIRKEYWNKADKFIEDCNDEELNVLRQQATKELNNRMSSFLTKFDAKEARAKKAKQAKFKQQMKQSNN